MHTFRLWTEAILHSSVMPSRAFLAGGFHPASWCFPFAYYLERQILSVHFKQVKIPLLFPKLNPSPNMTAANNVLCVCRFIFYVFIHTHVYLVYRNVKWDCDSRIVQQLAFVVMVTGHHALEVLPCQSTRRCPLLCVS